MTAHDLSLNFAIWFVLFMLLLLGLSFVPDMVCGCISFRMRALIAFGTMAIATIETIYGGVIFRETLLFLKKQ